MAARSAAGSVAEPTWRRILATMSRRLLEPRPGRQAITSPVDVSPRTPYSRFRGAKASSRTSTPSGIVTAAPFLSVSRRSRRRSSASWSESPSSVRARGAAKRRGNATAISTRPVPSRLWRRSAATTSWSNQDRTAAWFVALLPSGSRTSDPSARRIMGRTRSSNRYGSSTGARAAMSRTSDRWMALW